MAVLLDRLAAVRGALEGVPADADAVRGLADGEVLVLQRELAWIRNRVDALAAVNAGEIAFRSRRELGYAGLAQGTGARTPQKLVQELTGFTAGDASRLVRVGAVLHDRFDDSRHDSGGAAGDGDAGADGGPDAGGGRPVMREPWLRVVSDSVAAGTVSLAQADVIRAGLGTPTDTITIDALAGAAAELVRLAGTMHADRLAAEARAARDDLDTAGIADREHARHERRYLRLRRLADGMTKLDGLLDPESAAFLTDVVDTLTAPRRGGVRFIDPDARTRAEQIRTDPRSTDQLALDGILELLRHGTHLDPDRILGTTRPAVRVLVTADSLNDTTGTSGSTSSTGAGRPVRVGRGYLEGQTDPVSIDTVRRYICTTGTIPIQFDDHGEPLRLGREHRLFSTAQRLVLATIWGGCAMPDCDRPPSWTEAHHIDEWEAHHGHTDIDRGILLCRHHHLMVHNNHWTIRHDTTGFHLTPPKHHDPEQTPIPLHPKRGAYTELTHTLRTRTAEKRALSARGELHDTDTDTDTDPNTDDAAPRATAGARMTATWHTARVGRRSAGARVSGASRAAEVPCAAPLTNAARSADAARATGTTRTTGTAARTADAARTAGTARTTGTAGIIGAAHAGTVRVGGTSRARTARSGTARAARPG